MNCSDAVCQQLMTCKWDCSVSRVYCEAMWYPEREEKQEPPIPQVIMEQKVPEINDRPTPNTRRRTDYYGIRTRQ